MLATIGSTAVVPVERTAGFGRFASAPPSASTVVVLANLRLMAPELCEEKAAATTPEGAGDAASLRAGDTTGVDARAADAVARAAEAPVAAWPGVARAVFVGLLDASAAVCRLIVPTLADGAVAIAGLHSELAAVESVAALGGVAAGRAAAAAGAFDVVWSAAAADVDLSSRGGASFLVCIVFLSSPMLA